MTTGVSFKDIHKPTRNEAVQFCLDTWKETYDAAIARKRSDYHAAQEAHNAYRNAMPDLASIADIHDFIACLGRGILIKAVNDSEAAKLLTAARVASQAFTSSERAILKAFAKYKPGAAS